MARTELAIACGQCLPITVPRAAFFVGSLAFGIVLCLPLPAPGLGTIDQAMPVPSRMDHLTCDFPWNWGDRKRTVAWEATEGAYLRLERANTLVAHNWCRVEAYYRPRSNAGTANINVLLANRGFYQKLIAKVLAGATRGPIEFSGYHINVFAEDGPAYAGRGGAIHLRDQFFEGNVVSYSGRSGVMIHEFARVFLWDELPDNGVGRRTDVGAWDSIINLLANDYPAILATGANATETRV